MRRIQEKEKRILAGFTKAFKASGRRPRRPACEMIRRSHGVSSESKELLYAFATLFCLLSEAARGRHTIVPILSSPSWRRGRMTRAYRVWWIGIALAVAAGLSFAAPRANASCAASHVSFGVPALPFGESAEQAKTPQHSAPKPAPCPCQGPHCHKVPADPTAPSPAPPHAAPGQDWAWSDSSYAPPPSAGAGWAREESLFRPLSSPSPIERPPR
jgi:hypothetical protein